MSLFSRVDVNQKIAPFIQRGEGVGVVKVSGYGKASARIESYKVILDSYEGKNPIIESVSAITYLSYNKGNFISEPKLVIGISHKRYVLAGVNNNDSELEAFYKTILNMKNNEKENNYSQNTHKSNEINQSNDDGTDELEFDELAEFEDPIPKSKVRQNLEEIINKDEDDYELLDIDDFDLDDETKTEVKNDIGEEIDDIEEQKEDVKENSDNDSELDFEDEEESFEELESSLVESEDTDDVEIILESSVEDESQDVDVEIDDEDEPFEIETVQDVEITAEESEVLEVIDEDEIDDSEHIDDIKVLESEELTDEIEESEEIESFDTEDTSKEIINELSETTKIKDEAELDAKINKLFDENKSENIVSEEIQQINEELTTSIQNLQAETVKDNLLFKLVNNVLDPFDQVRKLHELKEDGIITKEEFEQKKKELLKL